MRLTPEIIEGMQQLSLEQRGLLMARAPWHVGDVAWGLRQHEGREPEWAFRLWRDGDRILAWLWLKRDRGLLEYDLHPEHRQQEREADARAVADAGRLGALALLDDDLDRALLLAREGVALNDSLESRGRLLAALLRSPAAIAINRLDGDAVRWLDASPDGARVAAGFANGTVALLDVRRRRQVGGVIAVAPADVSRVDFSFSPPVRCSRTTSI